MILFCASNGTIQTNFGTPVYQGSANSNILYLIAPFAPGTATVGFQLPDGTAVAPVAMTPLNSIPGVQNADGTTFAGWSYVLPANVTAKYGTVTAQFFFYTPTGNTQNPTAITATTSTSFQIGRGVFATLPDTPDEDIYNSILSNIQLLQNDVNNGYYASRAIYAWNSAMTYGANEITYYPVGQYGALVKSVQANNINQQPYSADGVLNSTWWVEVLNFTDIMTSITASEQAAAQSAEEAAQSAQEAAQSAQAAEQSSTAAAQSAQQAANSAAQAQTLIEGVGKVYYPQGEIPFASLPAEPSAQYRSYVWIITDNFQTDDRFVEGAGQSELAGANVACLFINGTYKYQVLANFIDMSNYAQINGNYQTMTVGKATQADNAATATDSEKLGGVLAAQYAINTGTYSEMSVGNADSLGTIPAAQYVQVNAQTFTDAQQNQARTNIGITNVVFGKYFNSTPSPNTTYIQCTCAAFTITSGTYYFINCVGVIIVSGDNVKVYITDSPNLTVGGRTASNWTNIYRDGVAEYVPLNSSVTVGNNVVSADLITACRTADEVMIYTDRGYGLASIGTISYGVNYCGVSFVSATGASALSYIYVVTFSLMGADTFEFKNVWQIQVNASSITPVAVEDRQITQIVCRKRL